MKKILIVAIAIFGTENPCAQTFSAFIGGTRYEQVRDIATDCEGNIYITGGTSSTDFPVTIGPKVNAGGKKTMDIFIMKFSHDGKLLWSTLLGGPNYDRAYALEVDKNCDVYIAGRAGEGLPTTRCAFQQQFGGDGDANPLYGEQDGFIAKFSRNGDLTWCSYFGGADKGFIRDIALDKAGNIFIVETETRGVNPHITANALQVRNRGGYDAVVAKITNDGKAVLWATYLGGSKDDMFGPSVRIDTKGRPVVAGTVLSADLPITSRCYDPQFNGESDLYVARFSSDGKELLLGTYLGGSGSEGSETHNLALDKDDNVVIASTTSSKDLPFKGGFQADYGGDGKAGTGMRTNYPHDGFVVKLSAEGDVVLAGTYIGGTEGEGIEGVGIDAAGNIHVSGATFSGNITASDKSNLHSGGADAFVATFSPDLSRLLFFSYIGGTSTDYGRTLHVDGQGNIYVAGETASQSLPAKKTGFDKFNGGSLDGFVAIFYKGQTEGSQEPCGAAVSPVCK